MPVAITLGLFALNFGVGGWAVWRVNRLLPPQITFNGKPLLSLRIFILMVVFMVATAPIFVAAQVIAALLNR